MIKAIIFDFSGVLFFTKDESYTNSHNKLHDELSSKSDYNVFDYFRLNEELLDYLKTFQSKYKLYIFTAGMIQNEYEVSDILSPIFDQIFSVNEVGFPKTNPQAFLEISKRINLDPEEILFIDDTLDNIDAAQSANLQVHHFNNNEDLIEFLNEYKIN